MSTAVGNRCSPSRAVLPLIWRRTTARAVLPLLGRGTTAGCPILSFSYHFLIDVVLFGGLCSFFRVVSSARVFGSRWWTSWAASPPCQPRTFNIKALPHLWDNGCFLKCSTSASTPEEAYQQAEAEGQDCDRDECQGLLGKWRKYALEAIIKLLFISLFHDKCLLFMLELY